jgi:DNA (cytosine-5)-methyltransferase 1
MEMKQINGILQITVTCVEICAGAGGQALGLHMADFQHVALVE